MNVTSHEKGILVENKTVIVAEGKLKVQLNYLIASGGQADIYHATYRGHDYAMKWYCKSDQDVIGGRQYYTVKKLCGGQNCPDPSFIWPLVMVTLEHPRPGQQFGYLMELIPSNYCEMERFLRKDGDQEAIRFHSFNAQLLACMNVAFLMRQLHSLGLSYKDLNAKNFYIDPETGEVLVVDNDNISVDKDKATVCGTPGYMAPEIYRSGYTMSPSRETDYYSMAVILYRLLFVDHPMDGKRFEDAPMDEERFYYQEPVFHFNLNDPSNRPTEVFAPNVIQRWKVMPREIRLAFLRSFTDGIEKVSSRLDDKEWISTLAQARERLIRVRDKQELFVNFSDPSSVPPGCFGLQVGGHRVAIYPRKAIYWGSIEGDSLRYKEIFAGIFCNPKVHSLMIRNLSNTTWQGWSPVTRTCTEIPHGGDYPVFPGVMIEFCKNPKLIGEIFQIK